VALGSEKLVTCRSLFVSAAGKNQRVLSPTLREFQASPVANITVAFLDIGCRHSYC
jgi:hypothetical protein